MVEKDKTEVNILEKVKGDIILMLEQVKNMFSLATDGFNRHKVKFLDKALEIENEVDQNETTLTTSLLEFSSQFVSDSDLIKARQLRQMIGDIERSGDYIKELVKRIETKINEGILFSDKAVKEYNQIYAAIQGNFENLICSLRANDKQRAVQVIEAGRNITELLTICATEHEERLIRGICQRKASGIYLDILDFMAGINRHIVQIAENNISLLT